MSKLFIFGNSITYGAFVLASGWADLIKQRINREIFGSQFSKYCETYNLGIPGDCATNILERMDHEIQARKGIDYTKEKTHIIITIGLNDSTILTQKNAPRFTDQEFSDNIQALIDKSTTTADRVQLIGITPVNDMLLNPTPWDPLLIYQTKRAQHFENITSRICKENSIPFLPLCDQWISFKDNYTDLLVDGVHPNDKGHDILYNTIAPFILSDDFWDYHS